MQLIDLEVTRQYLGVLLQGLRLTVLLAIIVLLLSLALAIPVAVARMSRNPLVRIPIDAYVELMRTTPLILQLIYIYYVLPGFGIKLDPLTAGIIGLTLHYTAYIGEVYRSGIDAIPRGQHHAAAALGMTSLLAFRRIILPQALRIVTPALGNYFITIFKDTALTSVMTVQELMFTGEIISARTYQYFPIYTLILLIYFAIGYPSAQFVRYLERATSRGEKLR
ncbi:MAG TPA: amino acid ABC transporter permease [Stellaceae bacterium]|nr:amino acid ABC transporter permease [Stellaceae bacterium]